MDDAVNRSVDFVATGQYESATISLHAAKSFLTIDVLSRTYGHNDVTISVNVIHKLMSTLLENNLDDSVDVNVFRFSSATLISDINLQLIRSGFVESSQKCCLELCKELASPRPARESEDIFCILHAHPVLCP